MTYPEDAYRRVEPGVAIGGPLKRDRAWLFAAYQPALIHTERTVTFTFDDSTATKDSDQTDHFFNINQTTQVRDTPAHARDARLEPVATGRHAAGPGRRHLPPGQLRHRRQDARTTPRPATPTGSRLPRCTWACVPGISRPTARPRTSIEQPLFVFMRANIGYLDVPASLQQVGGFQTDLSNDVSRVDRLSRVNAQADATYFGSLAGQHTLKAGLQFDRRSNDVDKGGSANRINLFWNARARAASGVATAITACGATPSIPNAASSRSATSATRPSACSCRTRGPCPTG